MDIIEQYRQHLRHSSNRSPSREEFVGEIERLRSLLQSNERRLSSELRRRGLILVSDPYANLSIEVDPEYVPGKPQD